MGIIFAAEVMQQLFFLQELCQRRGDFLGARSFLTDEFYVCSIVWPSRSKSPCVGVSVRPLNVEC